VELRVVKTFRHKHRCLTVWINTGKCDH
jgi:hypothetical protein